MNGLLTKLNIIKNNTLVKKGQLIYNHSKEGVLDSEGKSLPEGLYVVKSSQVAYKACNEDTKKKYYHTLELTNIACDGVNNLKLGSDNYSVSVDAGSFKSNFGISKQAKKGMVYEYIKSVFDKSGKKGFDPNFDYDSLINKLAWKIMNRSPIKVSEDDAEDIIVDVLMNTVNEKMIKKYDPSRDFSKFLIGYFYKRMLSYMHTWIHRKTKESPESEESGEEFDMSEEEKLDLRKTPEKVKDTPEDRVRYKDLLKGIKDFMKNRTRGKEQLKVFDDMLQGYSSTEIAERNNVSPSLITRYTNDIRDSLKTYAEKTGNQDLLVLMSKHSKKRMHSNEDVSDIVRVLNEYKKKYGEDLTSRKPVGEVRKVKRTHFVDKVSDDAIKEAILSDSYSAKQLKSEVEEYLSLLDKQDELLESEDGKLVGLKVISDKVRNVEEEAKCKKKKKKSKDIGFFVYSRCGMGPHKVLKTDGTFSIKLNKSVPVKIFKYKKLADDAASAYQHTKLNLNVGVYPDEYLKEGF